LLDFKGWAYGKRYVLSVGLFSFLFSAWLWYTYPLVLPVLVIAVLAGWLGYKTGHVGHAVSASLVVLVMAALLSYGSWKAVNFRNLGPDSKMNPEFMTWLQMGQLDLADRVARVGLIIGAAAGLLMFLAGNRENFLSRHGPGVVRGRKVVQGGWGSEVDLKTIAEFGPPREKPFGGGIVIGRLNGRILRILPEKGKIKMAGHVFVIGATGSSKSYTHVRNNIISAVCEGKSVVVTDPKGGTTRS